MTNLLSFPGGGGSSESAVVSIEIMDKLTAARMMIDNIG